MYLMMFNCIFYEISGVMFDRVHSLSSIRLWRRWFCYLGVHIGPDLDNCLVCLESFKHLGKIPRLQRAICEYLSIMSLTSGPEVIKKFYALLS